jgi:glycosyltransferase involved in cell wall biosynthesis
MPNQIVAVSDAMYHQIISQPGLNKSHIVMIHNAIPVEHFYAPDQRDSFRSELGLSTDLLLIGYSGRIEKVKRIDLLLLAFSDVLTHFPQARLILAGEGDLKPQLQDYAAKLGIDNAVFWLGFCREIPRFLAAIDVYVQSSSSEGLSLSTLEAMAAGKPIIATNVGGTNEILTEMETGLLIPSKSSSAISGAIVDLLEHPEKRLRLGEAARRRVLKEFNIQSMIDSYGLIYKKFIP